MIRITRRAQRSGFGGQSFERTNSRGGEENTLLPPRNRAASEVRASAKFALSPIGGGNHGTPQPQGRKTATSRILKPLRLSKQLHQKFFFGFHVRA